ncbi:hypothetical protein H4R18_003663 [Coemansia javaensis]|uniref:Cytochrome c oxidase assembly factor 6 n=1 Tax=Coemansia javaensis TaxID=2761396 RepID=A0A9W8H8E4_9FUNG|nr:hypothetical protein H4R18_003663 [Coemansia javaensis]
MSAGGNPPVPTREERKACHGRRDAYFACLDARGIDDPGAAGAACAELRRAMHDTCPKAWASYFEQLRAMQRKKARLYQDTAAPGKADP